MVRMSSCARTCGNLWRSTIHGWCAQLVFLSNALSGTSTHYATFVKDVMCRKIPFFVSSPLQSSSH